MDEGLLARLREITPEERRLLSGNGEIERGLYSAEGEFVVDAKKLLMKGQLIEMRTHTRFAHFPKHRHNYAEIMYMCEGETTHIINGRDRVVLKKGELLLLNQTVFHEILPAGENDIAVNFIILPPFFDKTLSIIGQENLLRDFLLSTLSGSYPEASYLHILAGGILPVQNLLENLVWTLLGHRPMTNAIVQETMGLLFLNISRFAENIERDDPASREHAAVFSTLRYIDSHYREGTLAEAAEILKMQTYALSRMLLRFTGMNFRELLRKRKLEQAAYLLKNTPLSVDLIMENIGYDNSSYFYRVFRGQYGCSPKEYRIS